MTARNSTQQLLADALGLTPSEIDKDTGLETCANWDSLAHFRVVTAVEEALGRSLNTTEIFETTDYVSVELLLSGPSNTSE